MRFCLALKTLFVKLGLESVTSRLDLESCRFHSSACVSRLLMLHNYSLVKLSYLALFDFCGIFGKVKTKEMAKCVKFDKTIA